MVQCQKLKRQEDNSIRSRECDKDEGGQSFFYAQESESNRKIESLSFIKQN